jgi:hypothetical protein
VKKHEGDVAAALLLNVNLNAVRGDFHGDLLGLRRAGRCPVGLRAKVGRVNWIDNPDLFTRI